MILTTVAEYYAGKSIFITGATGFLGKVLVEKLLRCCPDIKAIYILMRNKKGQDVKQRLEVFITSRVFERIKEECPNNLNKIIVISGDIMKEGLGMSEADRRILHQECQILFHSAASVRFDMPLKDAFHTNVAGTKMVLELAKDMKKLEIFLHISTAFCRSDIDVLEEKVYPSRDRPNDVMAGCRWLKEDLLNDVTPKIIAPEPNTYGYTKCLTEDLVSQYAGNFTIAIARPSIVMAAYEEPVPGWVDTIQGLTGIMVGGGKGVIRSMHAKEDACGDMMPVDMAVNGCILIAYKTGQENSQEIQVFNITNSNRNTISWKNWSKCSLNHIEEFPFTQCVWYPDAAPRSSFIKHKVNEVFTHYLPAYLIDLLLFLLGKKTFMVQVQKKISKGLEMLCFYSTREWNFKNNNFLSLENILCPDDKKTYFIDVRVLDWDSFQRNYLKGIREYACKEDPANLPRARRNIKRLYYAHLLFDGLLYFVAVYTIYRFLQYIMLQIY